MTRLEQPVKQFNNGQLVYGVCYNNLTIQLTDLNNKHYHPYAFSQPSSHYSGNPCFF